MRSTLALLGVLLATAFLAVGGGTPLAVSIPAGGVALLAAWALARRAVRVAWVALRRIRTGRRGTDLPGAPLHRPAG